MLLGLTSVGKVRPQQKEKSEPETGNEKEAERNLRRGAAEVGIYKAFLCKFAVSQNCQSFSPGETPHWSWWTVY